MAPGMVSEDFLIVQPECLPFVLHVLLWGFPNIQATQQGDFLALLILLGIILLLDNMRSYLKVQWFIMWCQTRISLLSRTKSSLVDHSLAMSDLVRLSPTTSLYTSSKLVGSCYGLLVVVSRSSPAYRVSSRTTIKILQVSPQ